MLARRTERRRVNDALAVVSPLAFADAVESYVTSLQKDELRALVLRSLKRMDASERLQFAMFLGRESSGGGADEIFGGPLVPISEVAHLVEACDDLLPNRFSAFLRENPRAVPALGEDAVESILKTLPEAPPRRSRMHDPGAGRISPKGALLIAAALLLAIVPLVAQYAHQRGILAGIANEAIFPPAPLPHAAPAPPKKISARVAAPKPHAAKRVVHPKARRLIAAAPVATHVRARAKITRHTRPRTPVRVASVWKFDPQYNRFVSHARAVPIPHAPPPAPSTSNGTFEARARLAVTSYLGAVIAGNTPSALQHLGLPADGDPKAIAESQIVTRDTRAQVVGVKPADDGTTHVQVDLIGRRGEYFETFFVAADGPAVRIKDRYYIPVNRTAEELSARLLAKTTH